MPAEPNAPVEVVSADPGVLQIEIFVPKSEKIDPGGWGLRGGWGLIFTFDITPSEHEVGVLWPDLCGSSSKERCII